MIYTAFLMSMEETRVIQFFFFTVLFSFLGASLDIQNKQYTKGATMKRFSTRAFFALKTDVARKSYFGIYGFFAGDKAALKEKV